MVRLVKKVLKENNGEPADGRDDEAELLTTVMRISELAASHKAKDIKAYDIRGLTVIADALIVCSASSQPQLRAIFTEVKEGMREAGKKTLHTEGSFDGNWLVVDYGTVIFHLFREEARDFYDLDGLWGDAPLLNTAEDGRVECS